MKIGVLALQGAVIEHINHIKALDSQAVEVKNLKDLEGLNGLIIPGGESTAIGKILRERNMLIPLKEKIAAGLPVWGTCAGMILLANKIAGENTKHLQVIDITVKRNAYGGQLDSFITKEIINEVSDSPMPLTFIRAPYIVDVGENVEVLHKVNSDIVAAKEKNILVTSFHPELSDNLEFHKYFLKMCNTL